LNICQFVHENWLPTERGNSHRFRDFVRDGLPSLFEKFIFNFYRHELPDSWHVSAPFIQWQKEIWNQDAAQFLPRMETDVCIEGPERAIILDAKFYAQALKANEHGSPKLSSVNLYQLFTYLRQKSAEKGWENADGILLYPRTGRDFYADFTTQGHRIRALTVDLFQPWKIIHRRLVDAVLSPPTQAQGTDAPITTPAISGGPVFR
jgi:5-methylcytosine-specific restriction enzyme subunit McrC